MVKRNIKLRCLINMQSRLCSTLSNRSVDFQGRVSADRKGKVGVSVLTTVWITQMSNMLLQLTAALSTRGLTERGHSGQTGRE